MVRKGGADAALAFSSFSAMGGRAHGQGGEFNEAFTAQNMSKEGARGGGNVQLDPTARIDCTAVRSSTTHWTLRLLLAQRDQQRLLPVGVWAVREEGGCEEHGKVYESERDAGERARVRFPDVHIEKHTKVALLWICSSRRDGDRQLGLWREAYPCSGSVCSSQKLPPSSNDSTSACNWPAINGIALVPTFSSCSAVRKSSWLACDPHGKGSTLGYSTCG
jgi:hypothetical protein